MGWGEFEWDAENLPGLKLGLHIAQVLLAFVAFALEISVFKDDKSSIVGNNGWAFAVCFLSIPAWIYLCMAPRFPRTRKLAQPVVMAVVDGVFAVLWLSAFAAQAAYNSANLCGGACGQSKAIVAMGVFVCLLFCGTTFLSIYTVKFYEWNGRLPGYDKGITNQNIDPDKAAFSMAPHDEEAYAHVPMNDHDHDDAHDGYAGPSTTDPYGDHAATAYDAQAGGGSAYDDTSYGGAGRQTSHGSATGYAGAAGTQDNPFRQDNPFDDDHEYATPHQSATNVGRPYAPPTAEDLDDDRPVQFPAANYDRVVR
ncbi:Chaperone-binding protein [Coniochaeta hoffmannii]|uniref:Chaperone-binding protein n=1 Tax=Coniochaeta hoffmannii TaxID=91930 RepID=A0AA38RMA0_9PEZI|nr:Chaperone-binding protein [Coniochaeta hoffmannii]